MSNKKFNHIAAIVFAISLALAGGLFVFGLSMNPSISANASEATIDETIISAQGTNITEITTDIPETVSEQMNDQLINKLDNEEAKAEAQERVDAQVTSKQASVAQQQAQQQAAQEAAEQVAQQQAQQAQQQLDTTRQHYATVTGSSGHTETSEQINGSLSNKTPDQAPNTINFLGETIPFVDSYDATRAPEHGAGVWRGDELVDDGQMCYFVGHNPGDFHNVMNLRNGNMVTVSDTNGHTKTYVVHDTFTVPQKSTYGDIVDRVEGHGESVVLQTCCGDNVNVRIVVAW